VGKHRTPGQVLQHALTAVARDAVEKVIDEKAIDGELPDPEQSDILAVDEQDRADSLHVLQLFNVKGRGADFYVKLYKRAPLEPEYRGHHRFLMDIEELTRIQDLESEIQQLVIENEWESGQYEAYLHRRNDKRWVVPAPLIFSIGVPKSAKAANGNATKDATEQAKEIYKLATETAPKAASADAILQSVTQAYKQGAELAGKPAMNWESMIPLMTAVLTALKPAPPPPPVDVGALITAIANLMKPAGTEQTVLVEMLKQQNQALLEMQKSQLAKDSSAGSLKESLAVVKEVAGAMRAFSNSGEGEGEDAGPTFFSELGRSVGQGLPEIVGHVKDLVVATKNAPPADVTATMQPSMPAPPSTPPRMMPPPQVNPSPAPPPPNEAPMPSPIEQLFAPIKAAVTAKNQEFFPELTRMAKNTIPTARYDELIGGQMSADLLISLMRPYAGAWVETAESRTYFAAYLRWLTMPRTATCAACHTETLFDSYEPDPACDACGRVVTLTLTTPSVPEGTA
jgi:hypothetical protein